MKHGIAERTVSFLAEYMENADETTYEKLKYGVALIYMNVYKTALLIAAAVMLGIWREVLIFAFSYCLMRTFAHGVHLNSGLWCTAWGLVNYIGSAYLVQVLTFDAPWTYCVFAVMLAVYAIYAPSATKKRPLGRKERKKLKAGALLALGVLFALTVFFKTGDTSDLLIMGIIAESINILPVTYRIFRQNGGEYK